MEALVPIGVWLVVALVGLGLLTILIFGIRSLMFGKVDKMSIIFITLPIALMLILGLVMGDWTMAGMYTLLIMIGLAIVTMLVTSVRGVFR